MDNLSTTDKKESAMIAAGATREAAYGAVVRGLTAKKLILDKMGDEHYEEDTTNQLRSAEIISRMNGDLRPETVVDNRVVNISGVPNDVVSGLLHMVKDVADQLRSLRVSGRQTGEIIEITAEVNQ